METQRPSSPARPRRSLLAVLAAVALGLLSARATAGLPVDKGKTDTRPLDRGGKGDARTRLVQAAIAYSAVTHAQVPVVALAQTLTHAVAGGAEQQFWLNDRRTGAAGAAQVAGTRHPFLMLPLYLGGIQKRVWFETVPTQAPPLNPAWLDAVTERERLGRPFMDLRERAPDELWQPKYRDGYQEYLAYCQAIVYAAQLPAEVFARSAADNPELNFRTLYNEPARQRGKVAHVEGRLKRLTRYDAPGPAARQGVKWIYEGWIFRDSPGPPVVVIFTDLPPELKLGDYARTPHVSFDGYFFKKFTYPSGNKDRAGNWRKMTTLLFIGPTLKVQGGPPRRSGTPMSSPLQGPLIYGVVGFVGFTITLLVVVNLWYRRNDRQIRSRLLALQGERFSAEGLAKIEHGGEAAPTPSEHDGREKNGHPPAGETPGHGNGHEPHDFP